MSTKTVYLFDPVTGEFTGTYDAQEDPMEPDKFIAPVASTDLPPPEVAEHQVAVFGPSAWAVQPDYRNVPLYSTETGAALKVESIGPLPDGVTELPRTSPSLAWSGTAWVYDLNTAKADKNNEINAARLQANKTTFTHAGKQVACDELSRGDIDGANGEINNSGAMPTGWPGGWKTIDNSVVVISTVAQWKAFYSSMYTSGLANFAHSQSLKADLAAATTPEQVAAIVW